MAENEKANSKDEKLSKEEFRQLIPHLERNQLFLIEIKESENWQTLFEAHYENKTLTKIKCAACSEEVLIEKFEQHIKSSTHLTALEKVEQFFHPLFTSERKNTSLDENSETIEQQMQKANAIAAKIKLVSRLNLIKGDPFTGLVTLSLEELLTIKFRRNEEEEWKNLLTTKGKPFTSGKYYCVLCLRFCKGVIPLNDHLKGAAHRNLQFKVYEVNVPKYEHLTKYCQFSYSPGKKHALKLSKSKEELEKLPGKTNKSSEMEKYDKFKKKVANSNSGNKIGKKVEDLSKKTDSKLKDSDPINGLIGVEYAVKLAKSSQPGSFSYACCLCDSEIMASAEKMEKHLTSYEHRLKYCQLYYLDTIENFKRMISDCRANLRYVMPFVLEKIALGIDQYHGYGTPFSSTEEHFKNRRKEITEELHGLPHACQEFGPSFSNAVTAQEIRVYKRDPDTENDDNGSKNISVRFIVRNPKKPYLNMRHHVSRPIQKRSNVLDKSSQSQTSSIRREVFSKRSRSPSKEHVSRKRQNISRKSYDSNDIWSVYRDLISKAAIELENVYVGYRKQPEKHPLYDQEWNAFWRRRKEELMLEGKNYRSYNFQPEWTTYFRQRLEQLFGEDLQKSKVNVRRRLNIPNDAEEDSSPTSKYISDTFSFGTGQIYSDSTWDKTLIPHHAEEQWKIELAPKEVENPTVIHMLRLMTALEDHLGTLGTKILELLTKAVSLEKFFPVDSSEFEKQILTASNYKLLKTAVEKLKSKLYADLIEGNKVNSFKRVIECTETILKKAELMGWANDVDLNVNNDTSQIQKLIEVLQEKKTSSPSLGKKSLSDALMEVISMKKLKETPISLDNSSIAMRTPTVQFDNNIPQNYYSGMETQSMVQHPTNLQGGLVNRNPMNVRGHGNRRMNFNKYASGSFGNMNPQWSYSSTQFNYPSTNPSLNPGFMDIHPNVSNNGNWMS